MMTVKTLVATFAIIAVVAVGAVRGQAPAGAQQPQQEVKVTTTKLGGNVYAVDGQGGRISALVGTDGIFLVDAQFPQVTDKIVAALKAIAPPDARVKLIVNTHVHGDHTGGNENFG